VAAAFLRVLENRGIIRKPRQVHRMMCITWNRAANTLATWPQSRLAVPSTKRITRLAGTTSRDLSQQRPQPISIGLLARICLPNWISGRCGPPRS
jgi:hypothetical protein